MNEQKLGPSRRPLSAGVPTDLRPQHRPSQDEADQRILGLLSAIQMRRPSEADLNHVRRAIQRSSAGDTRLASVHFSLAGLGRPAPPGAARRLLIAQTLIDAGVDPDLIIRAASGDMAVTEPRLKRYDPNQPRRPAGERDGGQWIGREQAGDTDSIRPPAHPGLQDRGTRTPYPAKAPPPTDTKPALPGQPPAQAATPHLGSLSMIYETRYRPGQEALAAAKVSTGMMSDGQPDPGGVSYGAYQMTSTKKTGQIVRVFLVSRFGAQWAPQFDGQDPTVRGGAFGKTWKTVAQANSETFFDAQHAFIQKANYDPVVSHVLRKTGLDIAHQSNAVQNVIWSMAVQHGPGIATAMTVQAIKALPSDLKTTEPTYQGALIDQLYKIRREHVIRNGKIGLLPRFRRELRDAHSMLAN